MPAESYKVANLGYHPPPPPLSREIIKKNTEFWKNICSSQWCRLNLFAHRGEPGNFPPYNNWKGLLQNAQQAFILHITLSDLTALLCKKIGNGDALKIVIDHLSCSSFNHRRHPCHLFPTSKNAKEGGNMNKRFFRILSMSVITVSGRKNKEESQAIGA